MSVKVARRRRKVGKPYEERLVEKAMLKMTSLASMLRDFRNKLRAIVDEARMLRDEQVKGASQELAETLDSICSMIDSSIAEIGHKIDDLVALQAVIRRQVHYP